MDLGQCVEAPLGVRCSSFICTKLFEGDKPSVFVERVFQINIEDEKFQKETQHLKGDPFVFGHDRWEFIILKCLPVLKMTRQVILSIILSTILDVTMGNF